MTKSILLLTVGALALATPAFAAAPTAPAAKGTDADAVSTGVARARDRLDSATSTSSIKEAEISKLGALNLGEILRNIPGLRVESNGGQVNANITIRGLPLASTGAKFLQLQEDGLPALEFGDIAFGSADTFIRPDLTLASVEAIRGGSASTFTSNAPGGVINLISKTGEREGGAVQATAGLNYDLYRLDFDYGAHVSDSLRFNIGGFYHSGEGVRHTGYTAIKGGQLKLNITKTFEGGYIRFYGKILDDRTPAYQTIPVAVSGSNDQPIYTSLPGMDVGRDIMLSKYITALPTLDGNNQPVTDSLRDGIRTKLTSVGVETQFELAGWTVFERFRFSSISGGFATNYIGTILPAAALATTFGGPGAALSFASGPNMGQTIVSPATLNGNGLAAVSMMWNNHINSLDNMTNDVRASRVWKLGEGELTTTLGFYKSLQNIAIDNLWSTQFTDVLGGGQAHLLNLATAGGFPLTQNGVFAYGIEALAPGWRRRTDVEYGVNAPYGSVNYKLGRFSIGASLRYDMGKASGTLIGSALGGGRVGTTAFDFNGNGAISFPESQTAILPLGSPAPLDYTYRYLSYSTGVTYRLAEPLAVFARYSKGGRANADRILYSPMLSSVTGGVLKPEGLVDYVKQAEVGVKYRKSNLTLNLTGFWAKATEHNIPNIDRDYRAVGLEFEGGYHHGPFHVTAGATFTDAKITSDAFDATTVGNRPRHQAKLIFQATPQYSTDRLTIGLNFVGTGSSFTQENNRLKLPGYIVTNAFVQVRPAPGLLASLNVGNLFDTKGYTEVSDGSLPAMGVVLARPIYGRTITTSLRFDF